LRAVAATSKPALASVKKTTAFAEAEAAEQTGQQNAAPAGWASP
jgi:hypothetical protein